MIRRRRIAAGFTLVELVLSISLTALILVEIGMVFGTGSKAYTRMQQTRAAESQAIDALWVLAGDVARLACPTDANHPPIMAVASVDGQDAPLLRLRTIDGEVIDVFMYTDPDGTRLLGRRREVIDADPMQFGVAEPVTWGVLATDVTHFALRFFDGQRWIDHWDPNAGGALPRLIEVTVTLATADGRDVTCVRSMPIDVGVPVGDAGAVTAKVVVP